MTRRWIPAHLLAVACLLLLAGCGSAAPGAVVASTAAALSPVPSQPSAASNGRSTGRPGAAGQVVRCDGPVVGSSRAAPYEGEDTGSTPEAALSAAKEWADWNGVQEGFVLTGSDPTHRLYVFPAEGPVKQALIVRRGPALQGDGTGATTIRWWLESWARCDYAELPAAVAREAGLQIWVDGSARRRLTSDIVAFDLPADCSSGSTALDIGGPVAGGFSKEDRAPTEYVRRPAVGLQDRWFDRPYADHVRVPADAVDSGYHRADDHLWFSTDRGYAYVGTRSDAEAWPRAREPIRCA